MPLQHIAPGMMPFLRYLRRLAFFAVFGFCASWPEGWARELISLNNEFGVLHDFSNVTLGSESSKSARVFFDRERFVLTDYPPAEMFKLREAVDHALSAKATIVPRKEDANYLLQIRMERGVNYSIGNPQGQPSQGFVMISLCKFPISDQNCDNMQYNYFKTRSPEEVFGTVLAMWLARHGQK